LSGVAAVGDNVADIYESLGLRFPGGNCLNVAVAARTSGHRADRARITASKRSVRAFTIVILAAQLPIRRAHEGL
jgi:hypothetical protein